MSCQMCQSQDSVVLPWGEFCVSCLRESKLCDGCHQVRLSTSVKVVGNQLLCTSCAVPCSKCGSLHIEGSKHRGKNYCNKCAEEFSTCTVCGKVHLKITISDETKLAFGIVGVICGACLKEIKKTTIPNAIFTCGACGKLHIVRTDFVDTPCGECLRKQILCVCCGKVRHKIAGSNTTDSSKGLCAGCHRNQNVWRFCNCCSDYHSLTTFDNSARMCRVCVTQYFSCGVCQERSKRHDAVELDGVLICKRCYQNAKCSKCGAQTLDNEASICYSCCDTHKIVRINNYSFRPRFKMFGNGVHLGVENEIANVTEENKEVLASVPRSWMYMKSDSSVACGVECVFHPTTLSYFKDRQGILDSHFNCAISQHESAGMHIHMSKDKFGTYQLFKFIQFFKDHAAFVDKIAGRCDSRYAKHLTDINPIHFTKKAKNNGESDRYRAININNEKTIEVRSFAGVVDTESFMKNVEFCDALYNFTKDSPCFKGGKVPLSYFVAYVAKHKNIYSNLNVFLGGALPKEVPENYKVAPAALCETVISHQNCCVEDSSQMCIGSRVILTSARWEPSPGNPCQGSVFACEGTLRRYSTRDMGCSVAWSNGWVNAYSATDLTLAPTFL